MKKILIFLSIALLAIYACESDGSSDSASTSGKGGSMARFAISGNYLYTVSDYKLSIYNINNPGSPEAVTDMDMYSYVETIFAKDSLLFFGTRTGMLIYDIKNPVQPEFISEYWHIYSCDPVVVEGDYAYVTLNTESAWCGRNNNRLDIIDISNIQYPQTVKEYDMTSPKGLGIDGNTLFLCDDGLKVYNVEDKYNIKLIEKFDVDAYDVIPDDGYLFLIGENGFYQYAYKENSIKLISSILTD